MEIEGALWPPSARLAAVCCPPSTWRLLLLLLPMLPLPLLHTATRRALLPSLPPIRFFYRFPHGESGADVYDRMTVFQVPGLCTLLLHTHVL